MPSRDLVDSVIPQFFPSHWLQNSPDLVHSEFPSRIRIGYAIRRDTTYEYLMRDALDVFGLDVSELHELALTNLRALPMPSFSIAKTPGGHEAFLADDVDNFTAARILLPTVRRALADELGAEHFAAIPCRDWFICWSKEQRADHQARNTAEARAIFLRDDYNLTPDILLVSAFGFALHLEQEV